MVETVCFKFIFHMLGTTIPIDLWLLFVWQLGHIIMMHSDVSWSLLTMKVYICMTIGVHNDSLVHSSVRGWTQQEISTVAGGATVAGWGGVGLPRGHQGPRGADFFGRNTCGNCGNNKAKLRNRRCFRWFEHEQHETHMITWCKNGKNTNQIWI